jgi:hypothetical protein
VKGTWRQGFLAVDPGGYVEKALERGISFHKGHAEERGISFPKGNWGTWKGYI